MPVAPAPAEPPDAELRVADAVARITAAVPPLAGQATMDIAQALGRVLAADVISPIDVPGHDNAAMDGFAFDGAVLAPGQPTGLRCVGTLLAGARAPVPVARGECLRIMTGAALPAGLDTVAPFEQCGAQGDRVQIAPDAVRRGEHRRQRGEDLARGSVALAAGRVLRPADLGLLASLGLTELAVRPRPRVALFSSGNELVEPGQPLRPGSIYDSNRRSLAAALQRLGMAVLDLGAVPDEPAALRATLQAAAAQADAVVTSGGVSAGDADHLREVLAELGEIDFWKIAMRPGRPFAFGRLHGGAPFFALPGNPVAALVAFYVLARPGLLRLAGAVDDTPALLQARCATPLRKRPGRREFQRGVLSRAADGQTEVHALPNQGSGVLRSMSQAQVLIVLDEGQGPVPAGTPVNVWPLEGLV